LKLLWLIFEALVLQFWTTLVIARNYWVNSLTAAFCSLMESSRYPTMSMNRACTIYSSICFLTSGDNVLCELRSRDRVIVFLRR